jgi:DNA mismatch repair protein MSH5
MARKSSFKIPFRHKSSRSNVSSRSESSRHTSNAATSRRSSSIASARPSRAHAQTRRGSLANNRTSTRAPSESVTHDSRPDEMHDDDTLNEIIMAVDMTPRQTVGCCYYVARDEKLFFMEDIQFGDADVVDGLRIFINPTVILVSTKIDDTVIDRFDPEARNSGSASVDNDQFRLPFLLEVRPPSEFYYNAAKSKLVNLHLGEENGTRVSFNVPGELGANDHLEEDNVAGQQGQLLRLAGWIDIESRVTVSGHLSSMLL